MRETKSPGFGSRIAFDNKNPSTNFGKGNCLQPNPNSDRSKIQVELNYYVVEQSPQNPEKLNPGEKRETSRINSNVRLRSGEKGKGVDSWTSPTDTDSNESFYSCHSSTSLQEAKPREKTEPGNTPTSSDQLGGETNTVIREEELLNQLTMVNAIFLRKNWGECMHSENFTNNQEENRSHGSVGNETLKTLNTPASPNLFCSEAFNCQIDCNIGVKFMNKMYEGNISPTLFTSNQNVYSKPDSDCLWLWEQWDGNIKVSKPCQSIATKSSRHTDCFVEDFSYTNKEFEDIFNKRPPSKFVFRRRKNARPSIYKKLKMELPKMKFAKIMPICDESDVPILLKNTKSKLMKIKFEVSEAHEVMFLEHKHMNTDSIVISPENEESNFKSRCISCGDGNQVHEQKFSFANNFNSRSQPLSLVNDIDESYLRTLIDRSMKKIQSESTITMCAEEEFSSKAPPLDGVFSDFNGDENLFDNQEDIINEIGSKVSMLALTQSLPVMSIPNPEPNSNESETRIDAGNIHLKCKRTHAVKDKNNNNSNNSDLVTQTERCSGRRRHCQSKYALPVIEEESLEFLLSEMSEDNEEDDYCLVDQNGRPIHLFDYQGLPLTDRCGRPLRSANGNILIKCDKNGIPMVGYEECIVFDMFGRTPLEDKFDPVMAPDMPVCNKLVSSDGKPLVIYDVEGRPLTSVSGTMLVDSSGRGLVRITDNVNV